jgi:Zn-finger protein
MKRYKCKGCETEFTCHFKKEKCQFCGCEDFTVSEVEEKKRKKGLGTHFGTSTDEFCLEF